MSDVATDTVTSNRDLAILRESRRLVARNLELEAEVDRLKAEGVLLSLRIGELEALTDADEAEDFITHGMDGA